MSDAYVQQVDEERDRSQMQRNNNNIHRLCNLFRMYTVVERVNLHMAD